MRFRRARFKNYRLLRDLEIDFSLDTERRLTVIRAENETGKTTILTALQWILFGDAGLPPRPQDYRLHPIDWDATKSRKVEIEAELEFEHTTERKSSDGDVIESKDVYLALRRATEEIEDTNHWTRDGGSFSLLRKTDAGWLPVTGGGELELRQIMGSNLKDLFFTDGDRALTFITSEISVTDKRKMVQRAIRDMLGFEILENARGHVEKGITQIRNQVRDFGGKEDLQLVSDRLAQVKNTIDEKDQRVADIERQLTVVGAETQAVEHKIELALSKGDKETLIGELRAKRDDLSSTRAQLERAKVEHSDLLKKKQLSLGLLRDRLREAWTQLEELKSKGRIPRTAIPVLQERLELGICICGTPLKPGQPQHEHVKRLIVEQQAASETDDRLTSLRLIANQLRAEAEDPEAGWPPLVKQVAEKRDQIEKRVHVLEGEVKAVEARIEELPDTDVGFLKKQRRQLTELRENLSRERGRCEADLTRLNQEYDEAKAEWDKLVKDQNVSSQLRARLTAAEDVRDMIKSAYVAIEVTELPAVSAAMNRYFLDMIGADPENAIIRKAEITPAYDITVYGPQDRRLDADRDLNGASRRALTLAFILALTEVSGVSAPNVIDTPLGMMSHLVKRASLSTAIDHAAQLVLFLTRAEIRDCEDLLDRFAGKVVTLSNTAHYPKMLTNKPTVSYRTVLPCDCSHREYCAVCERVTDAESSDLVRRV